MALNLISLLLVLGITFMHSIFGFFSGLINVFCTISAVLITFGFYEPLNDFITLKISLAPAYTEPICFILLFVISVIVLRALADNYIRGNVKLPMAVDVAGAGICGFINAQLFVGMLIMSVMMLPIGGRVLQYTTWERNEYNESDEDHPQLMKFDRNHFWLRSDEFTAGLVKVISSGSMRGKTTLGSVYPDFTEAIFFSTNTVQPESMPSPYRSNKGRPADGFEKGLKVEAWWEETDAVEGVYRKEVPTRRNSRPDFGVVNYELLPGMKFVVTRLKLDQTAADRDNNTAQHSFRPTMIRLVGTTSGGDEQHYPARILANVDTQVNGRHRIVDYDNNFSIPGTAENRIYAYFEVDQDFRPRFVEYRRHARAAIPAQQEENPEVVLTLAGDAVADSGDRRPSRDRNRTFGSILQPGSRTNRNLPFPMLSRSLQGMADVTLEDGKLASGRIVGSRSRLTPSNPEEPKVEAFFIPEDYRLVQIRYKPKEVQSLPGRVFNFVAQLNQYHVVDKNATEHPLVGYFAIVKRSRDDYIELYYSGDPAGATGSTNAMLDFKELERSEIYDGEDTVIGMLFLVRSGTELRRLTNQAGEGAEINIIAGG